MRRFLSLSYLTGVHVSKISGYLKLIACLFACGYGQVTASDIETYSASLMDSVIPFCPF
jgi:hypothetical protein